MLPGYSRREPAYINAGDTVQWERSFNTYPASQGWQLQYSIIGLGAQVNFASTPDGDSHAIDIPTAVTALWIPTDAAILTGYAVNAGLGLRHEIYSESCPVRPNLQNAPADQPAATFAQQLVTALEQLYLAKSSDDLLMAHVGDQTFKYESKEQVYNALCLARMERRVEVKKERARMGRPSQSRMMPVIAITNPGPAFGPAWPAGFTGGIP